MARPKRSQEEKELYVSMKGLKAEGWTDKLIQKFLGEPDKTARNPMFASASPVKLYSRERIHEVLQTKAFLEEKEKADIRKKSARKAVETKQDSLMEKIRQLEILVEILPPGKVKRLAIESYNDHNLDYGNFDSIAHKNNDKSFLDRITVNFIRHELTSYDHSLETIAGKTGKSLALTAIRRKVYETIANTYPMYREECKRQMEYRGIRDF